MVLNRVNNTSMKDRSIVGVADRMRMEGWNNVREVWEGIFGYLVKYINVWWIIWCLGCGLGWWLFWSHLGHFVVVIGVWGLVGFDFGEV
ncbi:hypothetical protein [Candidatus Hodgkinia cicadicola]|uniref:hypothetical protein n=1 Tax=Candidatus Hodgkinia cicadicola TaxID=573658 RepID=UPI0011BAACDC